MTFRINNCVLKVISINSMYLNVAVLFIRQYMLHCFILENISVNCS